MMLRKSSGKNEYCEKPFLAAVFFFSA